jgi:hypothetical protein
VWFLELDHGPNTSTGSHPRNQARLAISTMKNMASSAHLSPIDAVNLTTGEWRVGPLPWNLTVFNNSVPNNTIINGQVYNGSAINGTTIIIRFPSTNLGNISMISFIYMIISVGIIGLMAFPFIRWIQELTSHISSRSRLNNLQPLQPCSLSKRRFERRLREIYPPRDQQLQHSYSEKVPRKPGGTVTSQDLRECRELIRAKYALDVWLHNARDTRAQNRHILDERRRQSAGALVDIQTMVKGWVRANAQWSPEEWRRVQAIHERIQVLVQNVVQVPAPHGL